MSDVTEVATKEEALGVFDDPFLRWQVSPRDWVCGWATQQAVAVLRRRGDGHQLVGVGEPGDLVRLLRRAAARLPALRTTGVRLTTDAGVGDRIPGQLQLERPAWWEWMWTDAAPPPVAGEEAVRWVDVDDRLLGLLAEGNPRHHGRPGDPEIRGWAGIEDAAGELLAVGALAVLDTGTPNLRSITTSPRARGRGLGSAVSAYLTRSGMAATGSPVATLGLYSDNDPARRLYSRLGYRPSHAFVSGPLSLSTTASARSA